MSFDRLRAAARAERWVWLDGHGRDGAWSGRGSLLGVLAPDDVSLTFDATHRVVHRHRGAASTPVGDDVFADLEQALAGV